MTAHDSANAEQTDLMRQESGIELAGDKSKSILAMIGAASRDPNCDVAKMTAMHALFRQVVADEKKDLYDQAMSRLQPRLPIIEKSKKGANGKYAPIEAIDAAIAPLLKEEGFHFAFTSGPAAPPSKDVIVVGRLVHKGGHYEEASIPVALDTSGSKTATQGAVSTVSYGIRAIKRMMLDLNMVDEDRDGSNARCITEDQAMTITTLIGNIPDRPEGYRLRCKSKLLGAMAVSTIAEIPFARFGEAVNKLEKAAEGPQTR
jgi:hypothetical protein